MLTARGVCFPFDRLEIGTDIFHRHFDKASGLGFELRVVSMGMGGLLPFNLGIEKIT